MGDCMLNITDLLSRIKTQKILVYHANVLQRISILPFPEWLKFQNCNQNYNRSKLYASFMSKKTILITSVSNFELRCEISSTVQNSSYIFRKTNFYMLTQGEVSKFESTLSTVQNSRYMSEKTNPITSVNAINNNFCMPTQVWSLEIRINTMNGPKFPLYVRKN